MVREEYRELLRQYVLPVILDHSIAAHRLAATLHRKYGIFSTVCGPKQSPLDLLDPNTSFLSLAPPTKPVLLCEQLLDFAHTYDELILLLIPMNEEQERFLDQYESTLECHYIRSDPKAVFRFSPLEKF